MADQISQFIPFDLDTGGGFEYVLGVGLRISGAGGSTEALGESTMALSIPVVIASDQAAIDVSKSTITVTDDGSFTLATNTGIDIGDVDVTSVVPLTGATNLGKAIDVLAGAADVGVGALAVRDDVLAGITPAEGDWASLLVDANGALWCNINNTVAVSATNLDIRDLSEATDQVLVFANTVNDGSGTDLVPLVDASGHLQVDVLTGGGSDSPTTPTVEPETGVATASTAEEDLTGSEAAAKKLAGVDIWCSQRFKFTIHTVDDAVESGIKGIGGGDASQGVQWRPPHRDYIQLGTAAGLDAFRVVVTNLGNLAADTHAVIYAED